MSQAVTEIEGTGYRVKLEKFEGPLDLLLFLIKRDEIDIYDIPIAHVTEQFLAHVRILQMLDLDVAGEFLVMAATLMRIKAKMLLPRPEEEEEEEGDPREELVQRLLEYRRFKQVADKLRERFDERKQLFGRPRTEWEKERTEEPEEVLIPIDLVGLLKTFSDLIERAPRMEPYEVIVEEFTLEERIELIERRLDEAEEVPFENLFDKNASRREIIVTFIALLELLRLQRITLHQARLFERIWIRRRARSEDGGDTESEESP